MRETSQTAGHALQILLELGEQDGLTLTELSDRIGISQAAGNRLVSTLRVRAMVTRDASGRFFLGPGLIAVAELIPHPLASAAEPELSRLSSAFGETVIVSVPVGDEARVIGSRIGSNGPLKVEYEVGYTHPLSKGASGVAILAHLDEQTRRRLLPGGEERLAEIRSRGYVHSEGKIREHMVGLAAPILTAEGHIKGSIAIIAPTSRAAILEQAAAPVVASARLIGGHPNIRSSKPPYTQNHASEGTGHQ